MLEDSASLKAGTASGTFLSILPNIVSEDILKTAMLAAIGAVVSFLVSLALKFVFRRGKRQ